MNPITKLKFPNLLKFGLISVSENPAPESMKAAMEKMTGEHVVQFSDNKPRKRAGRKRLEDMLSAEDLILHKAQRAQAKLEYSAAHYRKTHPNCKANWQPRVILEACTLPDPTGSLARYNKRRQDMEQKLDLQRHRQHA